MSVTLARMPRAGIAEMEASAGQAAELLSALASPVRLLLLCALVEGEKSVTELISRTTHSQSAISQHLAKMRMLGLVSTRREGQNIFYRLASEEARQVLESLYRIYCDTEK
jgi:ArsR family transcriptional regulator, virulence genes transcriptional regulator